MWTGMDTKKILWFGLSSLILAGLIYFADVNKFLEALAAAEKAILIPALLSGISTFFVFSNTWHEFLNHIGLEMKRTNSFRLFMAGQFMNSITPLGQFGGEPFMAYIIKRNTDLSYEKAFSTVLSGDIVNGIPTLTFILGSAGYLFLFGSINNIMLQTVYAAVIIVGIGGPLVYLLWFKTGTIEGVIVSILQKISDTLGRGESIVNSVDKRMSDIERSFEAIGEKPRQLLRTAAIAHLSFIFHVLCLFFVLISLGYNPNFTPLYFVIVISGLAEFAPTPGGSGAFEATMSFLVMTFLGLPGSHAVVAAVLFRLCTYWPGIIIGYISITGLENGGKP